MKFDFPGMTPGPPALSRLAKLEKVLEAAGALLESMRMADRLNSQEARVLEKRIEEVKP